MKGSCAYMYIPGVIIALMHVVLGKDLQLVGNPGDYIIVSVESRVKPGSAFWSRGRSENKETWPGDH